MRETNSSNRNYDLPLTNAAANGEKNWIDVIKNLNNKPALGFAIIASTCCLLGGVAAWIASNPR